MLGTSPVAAPLRSSFWSSRRRVAMAEVEIVARVERRRKWSEAEKTALLAEVEAEGGTVSVVARGYRIAESLLYSGRRARKAAAAAGGDAAPLAFVPIGVVGRADDGGPALLAGPPTTPPEPPDRRAPDARGAPLQ